MPSSIKNLPSSLLPVLNAARKNPSGRRMIVDSSPILALRMRAFRYEKGLTVHDLFNWTEQGAKIVSP